MDDIADRVRAVIGDLVASGAEQGVQVAVYADGRCVADEAVGLADPGENRPVEPDTPFYNWSIGKAMTASLVHVLVAAGRLTYDTPVVDVWPEFAARGKERTTVRHLLSHTAGVPALPAGTTVDGLADWDAVCAGLADAEPWWEPGTAMGYHAYTFGFLVGEVVRRVTGTPLGDALDTLLAEPLGVRGELWFGMPLAEQHRAAHLEQDPAEVAMFDEMPDELPMFAAVPKPLVPTAALGNRAEVLAADVPAGGKVTARAVARLLAALVTGVDGRRLVEPAQLAELSSVVASGPDRVFGSAEDAWGLGHTIGHPTDPSRTTVFRNDGAGGSSVWADTATGVVVAVTKNRMTHADDAVRAVAAAVAG